MAIVVIGAVFVDIKGFPQDLYLPTGRNAGSVEFVHGGVGRNVAEDIANVELRPTFVSLVDESAQGEEVLRKLCSHKVNTDYIRAVPNGMGMWLAVFDQTGDLAGSISQRPDLDRIRDILDEKGDEIISAADSVVVEADMGKRIVKKTLDLAEKYGKPVYGVVANMGIATERRDLLQRMDCFVCNQAEAGILFEMRKQCPNQEFIPVPPEVTEGENGIGTSTTEGGIPASCSCNECEFMKLNTLEKIISCLETMQPQVTIPADIARDAVKPIEKMLSLS